jgi:hypothetical protein
MLIGFLLLIKGADLLVQGPPPPPAGLAYPT